jgi:hypothetical protein
VLGIASRYKKRLHKETADLAMVIAGLIGTALNKADLYRESKTPENPVQPSPRENHQDPVEPPQEKSSATDKLTAPSPPPEENTVKPAETAFHKHARNMKAFRRLHH